MHDDMMGESPRELELAEEEPATIPTGRDGGNENVTATTVGAANSNSNNNSPVERVGLLKESGGGGGRPANLFNVRFRSHVRASSDTTMITYTTKGAAASKLTEVYATAKDTVTPTTPHRETGMESEPPAAQGSGMELGPEISVEEGTGESSGMELGSDHIEECPIPVPRVELLAIPGGHVRAGADTDKRSLEVSTESNVSIDSDRKSAIVDIGYDL